MVENTKDDKSSIILGDSHCHLHLYEEDTVNQIIHNLQSTDYKYTNIKLSFLLTNSTHIDDFKNTMQIYNRWNSNSLGIIPSFGYHPWYLENLPNNWYDKYLDYIKSIPNHIKYAIGEIGIDGGKIKKKVNLSTQIEIFITQFELAEKLNKLVSIHCVYEWDKLHKSILEFYSKDLSKLKNLILTRKILLHSFQGNTKQLTKFIKDFNPWISISPGCYIEKNYPMLSEIPMDNLLLESDSPSMFNPLIYENEKEYSYYMKKDDKVLNHPNSIIDLAKKLSILRKVDYGIFINALSKNYTKLLSII